MAQWWEHSPPTNVARVRFGLSLLVIFSAPRSFLRLLRFPLSFKKHYLTWFVLIDNLSLQCPQLVLQR